MKKYYTFALAITATLGLGACHESPTGGVEGGTMSLLLTDAPGDFSRAIVTIERVELLRADNERDDSVGNGGDGNRIVLRSTPWTGDLLELSNDVDEIVADFAIAGGSYSELRFVISGGCIEVEGESGESLVYASNDYTECGAANGNLHMPSFGESGLKVKLPSGFTIDGDHRVVLVDFDVSESFGHQAGNSGKWVMHPVIRATEVVMSGNLDVTLAVADSVELPRSLTADSFMIRIGDEPGVAVVDGVASFDYLVPGTYDVDLIAPDSVTVTTDPALPLSVSVGSAGDAEATITITSAN